MISKRATLTCATALGFGLLLSYGCSSSGDYQGGGRRLFPPGGGDGTVLGTPEASTDDDTGTDLPDTNVPDTNQPPQDAGSDILQRG